jgi:hypothetical protein
LVGQAFGDRQALLVVIERFLELALHHQDIANLIVTHREIPVFAECSSLAVR